MAQKANGSIVATVKTTIFLVENDNADLKACGTVPVAKIRLKRRNKIWINGLPPALIYSEYMLSNPGLLPFLRLLMARSTSPSSIGGSGSSSESSNGRDAESSQYSSS